MSTASAQKVSVNTFEDLESLKNQVLKDGTAVHSDDRNGTVTGANNLVYLDEYRDKYLTGASEETEVKMATFGSSKTGDPSLAAIQDSPISRQKQKPPSSPEFVRITRAIFVKSILQALDAVQPFAQTPDAALYVHHIFHQIREFETISPDDPLLEVLSGLYVALSYDNLWSDYHAGQFAAIRKILKTFADRPELKPMDIEKAIMEMEAAGFNTTPIPMFAEASDE